jgi:hypothetical protein
MAHSKGQRRKRTHTYAVDVRRRYWTSCKTNKRTKIIHTKCLLSRLRRCNKNRYMGVTFKFDISYAQWWSVIEKEKKIDTMIPWTSKGSSQHTNVRAILLKVSDNIALRSSSTPTLLDCNCIIPIRNPFLIIDPVTHILILFFAGLDIPTPRNSHIDPFFLLAFTYLLLVPREDHKISLLLHPYSLQLRLNCHQTHALVSEGANTNTALY